MLLFRKEYSFHDEYFENCTLTLSTTTIFPILKENSFNFSDIYSFEKSSSLAQISLSIEYSVYIDDQIVYLSYSL